MTAAFGLPRHHHRLTDSTNERARELAAAGAPHGAVVTATEQSAGRGRRGRAWSAPAGKALLSSFVVRPLTERHALLPLAVPVAACEAIEAVAPVACEIKWPNDVWLDRRKVAGILIEARPPDWAVLGIGINVAVEAEEFPGELRWPAISIGHGAGVDQTLPALAAALGRTIEAAEGDLLAAYRDRDALRGNAVEWEGAGSASGDRGSGTAEGVDARGMLEVRTADGELVRLGAGEVSLRPAD